MNLLKLFIERLEKTGYEKRDIRFFGLGKVLKTNLSIGSINNFCRESDINQGSLYHMMNDKRAIPLDILNKISIDPSKHVCIIAGSNIPIKIPTKLTPELAYLVGVLRDGTVTQERSGKHSEYCCAYYSKYRDFLLVIKSYLKEVFNIEAKIERFSDVYGIRVRSLTLYLFFKLIFEVPRKQVKWNTPQLIEKANDEIKRWYIRGFWDAEGGSPKVRKPIKRKNLYIAFYQKNKKSLEFIKEYLQANKIETTKMYWNERKWVLKIRTNSIPLFVNFIGSSHPIKSKHLIQIGKVFS